MRKFLGATTPLVMRTWTATGEPLTAALLSEARVTEMKFDWPTAVGSKNLYTTLYLPGSGVVGSMERSTGWNTLAVTAGEKDVLNESRPVVSMLPYWSFARM